MIARRTLGKVFIGAVTTVLMAGAAHAQEVLKWAHVYETSEPFHTESVWAGEEISKRTNGNYKIEVYPASQLGKESDINQGLTLGTVDIIISGSSFAAKELSADRRDLLSLHLSRCGPSAEIFSRATPTRS